MWNKIKIYCQQCGKEIKGRKYNGKGQLRKYCCADCAKDARGRRLFGRATCLYCGKQFQETRDRPNKFCSNKCSGLYYAEQRAQDKRNAELFAEELFVNISDHASALMIQLTELGLLIRKSIDVIDRRRQCPYCGKWFISKNNKIFCSTRCCDRAHEQRRDRRIAKNGKADYSVTLYRLFARDNGVCQICGKRLSFDCDSNSNDYPSIDHIKPLSKGGLHTWDNVQLACRMCNSVKSDKWN